MQTTRGPVDAPSPSGDDQPRGPARRAAVRRWGNDSHVVTAPREEPGDQRVGVPHLAPTKLVAPPGRPRSVTHEFDHAPRVSGTVADSYRTGHRLGHVRYHAAAPAPNLEAEETTLAQPSGANRSLTHHTAAGDLVVPHRPLLDDEPVVAETNLERGVVEIARTSTVETSVDRLEDAAVQAHETSAGPERSQYRSTLAAGSVTSAARWSCCDGSRRGRRQLGIVAAHVEPERRIGVRHQCDVRHHAQAPAMSPMPRLKIELGYSLRNSRLNPTMSSSSEISPPPAKPRKALWACYESQAPPPVRIPTMSR